MKIYAINIATDTKNTDMYDKVSINKYPIIAMCKDIDELMIFLRNDQTTQFIKDNLKTQKLYDNALYYIREIDKGGTRNLVLRVNEINNVKY